MAALFRVRALFEYSSPHEDDLSFDAGQVIVVTEEEDDDWYGGEYVDAGGVKRAGIFPRNFVERFEPTAPPRPVRSRPRPSVSEGAPSAHDDAAHPFQPPPPVREEDAAVATASAPVSPPSLPPGSAPAQSPALAVPPPIPTSAAAAAAPPAAVTAPPKLPGLPLKPKPAPPPPVSEKPSSFKDRIAAFNKPAAPPVAPFKPGSLGGGSGGGGGGGGSSAFVKKPFVAPPPSRNAYIPPPREAPAARVYHRDEDPEVQEQVAESMGQAERAGLFPHEGGAGAEAEAADQPKPTSLKERIALLQKQQLEQAQRHADVAARKDKPKKPPPKKRLDVPSGEEGDESPSSSSQTLDRKDTEDVRPRTSSDNHRPAPPPPIPRKPSDGNEADISGGGEATESQDTSTEREDSEQRAPSAAPSSSLLESRGENGSQAVREEGDEEQDGGAEQQQQEEDDKVVVEEEEEEEEEEENVDPEVKRREELRARMARMSGGMGFAGMFGAPMNPFGGAAPPKKKAPKAPPKPSTIEEEASLPLPRAPPVPVMMALPGMGGQPRSEGQPRASEEQAELATPPQIPPQAPPVPEEPLSPSSTEMESAPPPPPPPPAASSIHPAPSVRRTPPPAPSSPPVPSGARLPPPPPPAISTAITSATEGSESDDELSNAARENPIPEPSPTTLRSPLIPSEPTSRSPPPPSSPRPEAAFSPTSPATSGRRFSRPPPPIPGAVQGAAAAVPAAQARPPPPAAPRRPSSSEVSISASARLPLAGERVEEEVTEYDGDCDTDIASSVHHRDALKPRNRAPSVMDNASSVLSPLVSENPATMAQLSSTSGLRPPPPPAPPSELARRMSDAPAAAPPLPPLVTGDPAAQRAPAAAAAAAASPQEVDQGYVPAAGVLSSSYSPQPIVEDELQDSMFFPGVPRKIAGGGAATRGGGGRLSVDAHRSPMTARRSMDHHRPSMDPGFIASDVDLAIQSGWWKQANQVPPALQGRKDIHFESEETTTTTTTTGEEADPSATTTTTTTPATITRETFVLYQDYSQTVFTARYDPSDPTHVDLEQRHEPPPIALRQDQMEDAYDRFGRRIASAAALKKDMVIGDGTPQGFVLELMRPLAQALRPVGARSYGALVYANMANASTQQHDVIRAGDILTIRNAKFQGKHGPMHAKYAMEVGRPDHVAVVAEWDGTKKKVRAWEQGRDSKKVRQESYKLDDLRSGEVKIWRVVSRSWVGWQRKPEE